MDEGALRITGEEVKEDRFSRFRLLNWWDQERIRAAKILVVGAGALGNEILKNLALLGFERVVVVDSDRIETSNLSRSILYRPDDVGRFKAEAAAESYTAIYNRAIVQPLVGDILLNVGLGLFGWADVILAGLDNREARLWINRAAWKMNRPWIDGAIEGLSGMARAFLPGKPPCYECTLGETDWQILRRRMSCNLLTRDEMEGGKVPTTPTTASVIAGIQVQEAVKLIHGLPVLAGKSFVFDGLGHTSYVVEYTENPECFSHETYGDIIHLPCTSTQVTLEELYDMACRELRSDKITLEFSRDIVHKLVCPSCGHEEQLFVPLGMLRADRGFCPEDGSPCQVVAVHEFTGNESYGRRNLRAAGLPLWDVYVARSESREVAFLLAGDEPEVLGALAEPKGGGGE